MRPLHCLGYARAGGGTTGKREVPEDASVVATTTDYGRPFVSSVWRENVMATQFHPEKSQKVGLQILENFAGL